MRKELYEQYKQEHPEEMTDVRLVQDYSRRVEEVREVARQRKVSRVAYWKRIFEEGDI